ncbi:hypothetical protein [Aurantimonas sp. 22II-16-19i]|uniref:hypothetical protein n=1 Tax=Aurantimonas sp. 22II-16-19i TaxID=1317114 RepID=UPI0009F7F3C5|nr:hypothetical protein [Aurantimonas sp. 22II-16-19i]ORE98288.1 hypothetical protein ATO4_04872 [Aurantimonas sp. 22II-16-19i]
MMGGIAPRALAAVVLGGLLAGCQSAYDDPAMPQAVSYQRVAPDGRSGQRLGPDGYPLLGAFPNVAAPQVDDATVSAQERRTAAVATRGRGAGSARGYEADIARMQRVRRQQAEEVEAALAAKPDRSAVSVDARTGTSTGTGTGAAPSRTPEEVLRQIQSGQ